ncbi:MAG: hypothetical protein O2924_01650 [Chloroflexi bacterium]|nr:hypothetical protein [Chloroflexota bacterium]
MIRIAVALIALAGAAAIGALTVTNNEAALWISAVVLSVLAVPFLVAGLWQSRRTPPSPPGGIHVGGGHVVVGGQGNVVRDNIFTNTRVVQPTLAQPQDWWDAPDSPRFRWEQSGQASASDYRFDRLVLNQVAGTAIGTPYVTVAVGAVSLLTDHPLELDRERSWSFPRQFTVEAPMAPGESMPAMDITIRFWWDGAQRTVDYIWPLDWRGTGKHLLDVRLSHAVTAHR